MAQYYDRGRGTRRTLEIAAMVLAIVASAWVFTRAKRTSSPS